MRVLALNSGSSSLKFGLYRTDGVETDVLVAGALQAVGTTDARVRARFANGGAGGPVAAAIDESMPGATFADGIARIGRLLDDAGEPPPDVVGHRIVHGGPRLRTHCRIDDAVLARLEVAVPFAPLHVPSALALIRDVAARLPGVPQVACFDTAFHATLDERARVLPLPRALQAGGVERYGFHGLSCESIVAALGDPVPERLIVAHLGSGASVTAIRAGRSVDTSMGLTPTGGVMMSSRSGDLDPGVLLWLLRERRLDAAALEDLLDRRSGLLGVSQRSGDLHVLREQAASDVDARLAIAMFCRSVAKSIAAMIVALDGVDRLVFTGGIGEHDPASRAAICADLHWIGVHLDDEADARGARPLQAPTSRCAIDVIPSDEEGRIVAHAFALAR